MRNEKEESCQDFGAQAAFGRPIELIKNCYGLQKYVIFCEASVKRGSRCTWQGVS